MKLLEMLKTEEGRAAFRVSNFGIVVEYVLLALCGAATTLAFPAMDFTPVAWVCLIPLFFLGTGRGVGPGLLRGFVWGYFHFLTATFWIREIEPFLPYLFAAVLGAFPAMWTALCAGMRKYLGYSVAERLGGIAAMRKSIEFKHSIYGVLFLLGAASAWTILEWLRSWIFTGMPWNLLATTQWNNPGLIQIAEFTGIYGVSFVVAVMNIGIAMTFIAAAGYLRERKYRRPLPLMTAALLLMSAVMIGWHGQNARKQEMKDVRLYPVGIIQPDLSQRRNAGTAERREALEVSLDLSGKLLEESARLRDNAISMKLRAGEKTDRFLPMELKDVSGVRLIVWPETSVPTPYNASSDFAAEYRRGLGDLISKYEVPFLIGSIDFEPDGKDFKLTNSALLVDRPYGAPSQKTSKRHLVPFGEYVPWGDVFPKLNEWIGMGRNLTPGRSSRPLEPEPGVRIGVSICFESVFPEIARAQALNGANVLAVLTNDAWYPTSFEPDQHFVNSIFRAVENRLPLLRCGNSSYSALISPYGTILDAVYKKPGPGRTELPAPELKGRGQTKFMVPVPRKHVPTFYTTYGNVFIALCGFILFCAFVTAFVNWRSFRLAQLDATLLRKEKDAACTTP